MYDENGFYRLNIDFLNKILQLDPFALLPCDSLELLQILPLDDAHAFGTMYQRVGNFRAPQAILDRINDLNKQVNPVSITGSATFFNIQLLADASSAIVNCDFYPVNITRLPTGFTASTFAEYYRTHMNDFIDNSQNITFSPYIYDGIDETTKFNSAFENSTGAIIHIKMPNNATVVQSNYYKDFTAGSEKHRLHFLLCPLH